MVKKRDESVTISSVILSLRSEQKSSTSKRVIRFLTPIRNTGSNGGGLFTTEIKNSSLTDNDFFLEDDPQTNKLVAFRFVNGAKVIVTDEAGTIDYDKGIIEIDAGVSLGEFNVIVYLPSGQNDFTAKENMLLSIDSVISLTAIG